VVPVLLGLFGAPLPAWSLVAVLLAVAVWHVLYRRVAPSEEPSLAPAD
jgi:hypothetical protein